jgi:hypothetical protein
MENKQEKEIIDKYLSGNCTPEEKETIESWYLDYAKHRPGDTDEPDYTSAESEIWNAIQQRNKPRVKTLWPRLTATASILLLITIGVYFIRHKQPKQQIARIQAHDIAPGTNKAILTLDNGKKIILTNAKNGLLASQGSTRIDKTKDGAVQYNPSDDVSNAAAIAYNTISTPKGGKYTITLADGTTVSLDALSSVRFPTTFNGNTREVTTTGQVYFEVAHNTAKPFRVHTNKQTVEVLGTHFNISAYEEELTLKTTLLQGSIKITQNGQSALLKPGEQSQTSSSNNKITVIRDADVDEAIAWKNGFFQFNDSNIKDVMNQLSRWYDVDVQYEGKIPERTFSGKIYKNVNASQVLNILSYSKVHFRIEGKKIIVTQ